MQKAFGLFGTTLVATLAACASVAGDSVDESTANAERSVPDAHAHAHAHLQGDRNACPEAYRTRAPVAGKNGGYVIDDQERNFSLLLPAGAVDPSKAHPLLVNFNPTGTDGEGGITWEHLQDFADRGFVVLAPSSAGNGTAWPVWDALRQPGTEGDPNKDLDYFDSLVSCVASYVPIEKSGVYVAGHSAGGIMANYVLQRRSQLLAGGIVGSGVFSLTSPSPATKLDPMFVVVTWGGSNDHLSDPSFSFNFINEAALASQFYNGAPNVSEVNCRGNDLGHAWLSQNNAWFIDLLLQHPKGHASLDAPLPATTPESQATCQDAPFEGKPAPEVMCGASQVEGCQQFCQFVGDCAVENTTIQPVLHDQIVALGFSGNSNTQCGGCVTLCDTHGTGTDPQVLSCFKEREATAACGQGIEGVLPLVDAVNACCDGRTDSPLCMDVCRTLLTQEQAGAFFPTCSTLLGQ